jgi:hypothetical protein
MRKLQPLGRRQLLALDLLCTHGPLDGLHLGRLLCAEQGRHPPDDRCEWCMPNGIAVLVSLAHRQLVRVGRIEAEIREEPSEIDADAELERLRAKLRVWETER